MSPHSPCPHTDAVLARFLDGDTSAVPCPEELTGHLEECDRCRDALQEGRRLDALLAAQAGRDADHAAGDAVLARALARVTPPAPGRRRPIPLFAAAGLLAAGFLAAWLLLPRPEPAPRLPSLPPVASHELTDAILLSGAPPRRRPPLRRPEPLAVPRTDLQVQALAARFTDPSLDATLGDNLIARALSLGLPGNGLLRLARDLADELRLEAALALLQSDHPDALTTWMRLVDAVEDGPLLRRLLSSARDHGPLRRLLRQELGEVELDPLALALTARLGVDELDELLMEAARRQPTLVDVIAGHLAALDERPRRVALLLDLWTDLRARGQLEDDEETARRLLAPQPFAATAALVAEATTTRNGPRRQRCLLALAVRRDPTSLDFLLSAVQSPRQPDAVLAAYALSRLPPATVAAATESSRRPGRNPWLLHAAMAGARCAEVKAWLPEMDLTPEERQFLAAGAFNRDQFPIAAALFRERGISGY